MKNSHKQERNIGGEKKGILDGKNIYAIKIKKSCFRMKNIECQQDISNYKKHYS